jgi:hypothetical protein
LKVSTKLKYTVIKSQQKINWTVLMIMRIRGEFKVSMRVLAHLAKAHK